MSLNRVEDFFIADVGKVAKCDFQMPVQSPWAGRFSPTGLDGGAGVRQIRPQTWVI
jgi:hypothetical protein